MGVRGDKCSGFAAIDALVALTVLSLILSLALGALGAARRVGGAALEAQQARALLRSLLANAPSAPGSRAGRTAGFRWSLVSTLQNGAAQQARLCQRVASAEGLVSRRRYLGSSVAFCVEPRRTP